MNAVLFAGQGSQKAGMGKELYECYPHKANILRDILECTEYELFTDGDGALFADPAYVQPVIFAVSALWFDRYLEEHPMPDMCAGHSLGEYAALYCAGALGFEDGIQLLKTRGQMTKTVKNGKMAAVTGVSVEELARILQDNGFDTGMMANFNTPLQTVLAGEDTCIMEAEKLLSQMPHAIITLLNVSCAFHTKFMKSCADAFNKELSKVVFTEPQIPVISNTFAEPYSGPVFQTLQHHMTNPVQWNKSICYMLDQNCDLTLAEPVGAMGGMIRKIKKERRE